MTIGTRVFALRDGDTFTWRSREYVLLRGYRVNRTDGTRCLTVSPAGDNSVEDLYLHARTVVTAGGN